MIRNREPAKLDRIETRSKSFACRSQEKNCGAVAERVMRIHLGSVRKQLPRKGKRFYASIMRFVSIHRIPCRFRHICACMISGEGGVFEDCM